MDEYPRSGLGASQRRLPTAELQSALSKLSSGFVCDGPRKGRESMREE